MAYNFAEGEIILINKSINWTSFDVVRRIRGAIKFRKIGHAGTLDPLATGLLILATGKKTKLISTFQNTNKEYTGIITLGGTTPCFDLEIPVDTFYATEHITDEMIYASAKTFLGEQTQYPPIFSAVKQNGKPLYILARKNEEVELKKRHITIHEFEITKIEMPDVHFRVVCTSGTYIRSLANDFGKSLQSGSHLSKLCRTKSGDFDLTNVLTVNDWIDEYKKQTAVEVGESNIV
jgi:tRNA pseudouridine55 synthase